MRAREEARNRCSGRIQQCVRAIDTAVRVAPGAQITRSCASVHASGLGLRVGLTDMPTLPFQGVRSPWAHRHMAQDVGTELGAGPRAAGSVRRPSWRRHILDMLAARARNATMCPSEVARSEGEEDWPERMEIVCEAARRWWNEAGWRSCGAGMW